MPLEPAFVLWKHVILAIANGFRKFFTTQLIKAGVTTELRWKLEGHNLKANDDNYVRTTEKDLLKEYEKAIDNLTINEENRLRKKVEVLEVQKSRFETIIKDVEQLKRKYNRLKA